MGRGRKRGDEGSEDGVCSDVEGAARLGGGPKVSEGRSTGGGHAERTNEVRHLARVSVDGRKVSEVVIDGFGGESRGNILLGETILRLEVVVEGVEDAGEFVGVNTKGLPAGLPDTFVLG